MNSHDPGGCIRRVRGASRACSKGLRDNGTAMFELRGENREHGECAEKGARRCIKLIMKEMKENIAVKWIL